jgi:hypothetical protein
LNEAPHHMILSLGLKMVDVWRQRRYGFSLVMTPV